MIERLTVITKMLKQNINIQPPPTRGPRKQRGSGEAERLCERKIMGLIKTIKSGWYSGKGFKAIRNKKYEKALSYLRIALENSQTGFEPVLYESLSIAYYNINMPLESIENAKKSIEQYTTINDELKYASRIKKLENIIEKNQEK
jgi:tetratricopeptide (TPR) repeat protein